jgi:hypothetical protein
VDRPLWLTIFYRRAAIRINGLTPGNKGIDFVFVSLFVQAKGKPMPVSLKSARRCPQRDSRLGPRSTVGRFPTASTNTV